MLGLDPTSQGPELRARIGYGPERNVLPKPVQRPHPPLWMAAGSKDSIRRAAREGFAFRFQPHDYEAFAASFGFEETPDQQAAIHAVIQDRVSPESMMSSTMRTCRPVMSVSRSLRMRTTPDDVVAEP